MRNAIPALIMIGLTASLAGPVSAQQRPGAPVVRIAELVIDPAQLQRYEAAVKEGMADAVRLEPGVLAIYSVAEKDRPNHLRFFEIYASDAAYVSHIESPHFRKYFAITQPMIQSRKVIEAVPVQFSAREAPGTSSAATPDPAARGTPAFYISEFELTDPEGIKPYSARVASTFEPFGGRYIVRGGAIKPLEGDPPKGRMVVIAFDSLEKAQAWYDSPAYRELIPIRHRSARSQVFLVEGVAGAAGTTAVSTPLGERLPEIVVSRKDTQASTPGPEQFFTGTVRVDPLIDAKPPSRLTSASVTFKPGARTAWHSHPLGQHLIVTSGSGWVQQEGGRKLEINEGDVVWTPPGVKHWHGATATKSLTHMALQEALDGKNVTWMEKVGEHEYRR